MQSQSIDVAGKEALPSVTVISSTVETVSPGVGQLPESHSLRYRNPFSFSFAISPFVRGNVLRSSAATEEVKSGPT